MNLYLPTGLKETLSSFEVGKSEVLKNESFCNQMSEIELGKIIVSSYFPDVDIISYLKGSSRE